MGCTVFVLLFCAMAMWQVNSAPTLYRDNHLKHKIIRRQSPDSKTCDYECCYVSHSGEKPRCCRETKPLNFPCSIAEEAEAEACKDAGVGECTLLTSKENSDLSYGIWLEKYLTSDLN